MRKLLIPLALLCAVSLRAGDVQIAAISSVKEVYVNGGYYANITYRNLGSGAADAVKVVINAPANTTAYFSVPVGANCNAQQGTPVTSMTCTFPTLAENTSGIIQAQIGVSTNAPDNAQLTLSAAISTTSVDAFTGNETASTTVTALRASPATIWQTVLPAKFTPGQHFIYSFDVPSPSGYPVRNLVVTDTVNSSVVGAVSIASYTAPSNLQCSPVTAGMTTLRCTSASFTTGGRITLDVFTDPSFPAGAKLTHSAAATGQAQVYPEQFTQQVTADPASDLSMSASTPSNAQAGQDALITLTARNLGPSDAAAPRLSFNLPPNTTYVSMAQTLADHFHCQAPANPGPVSVVSCSGDTFLAPRNGAPASPFVLNVTVRPSAAGTLAGSVEVASDTTEVNTGNNKAAVSLNVAASQSASDLAVTMTPATASVTVGTLLSYTVRITNQGPESAPGTKVALAFPAGISYQSIAPVTGCTGASPVVCDAGTLASGAQATFTVGASAPQSVGTVSASATVSSLNNDPVSSNNRSTANVTVVDREQISTDVAVTLHGPIGVMAGRQTAVTATVQTRGTTTAKDVVVNFSATAGVTIVSVTQTGGPAFVCTTDGCKVPLLASKDPATFTVLLQISPTATAGAAMVAIATVSTTTTDVDASNNRDSWPLTVSTADHDVSLALEAASHVVAARGRVTFHITVANHGAGEAPEVTLTDTLPAGFTFVSAATSKGSCEQGSPVVCRLGTLAANESVEIAIDAGAASVNGTFTNNASIASTGADADAGNDVASADVVVASLSRRRVGR